MGRLVIVSNRVGSSLRGNEGGLATAMVAAFDQREVIWFGWSGEVTDEPAGPTRVYRERRLTRMLVDLERSDYEGYYLEFANCVLWPLFHYRVNLAEYGRERWAAYNRVNEMFAERLAPALEPDDILWVHDYHLMPLGSALRRQGVDNPIGFFLHIPFPAPEVLATLPVHETLVRTLFDYDLVGFQTENDLQAFRDYVQREAGGWTDDDGTMHAFGTSVRAASFPISIDTRLVAARAARASSTRQAARLRDSLSDRRLVIGVDRLDYTKGLVHRFDAVERLLEGNPEYRRSIVVLQIATPSREDVSEYQRMRAELDARIGRINGRFGDPDHLPLRQPQLPARHTVRFLPGEPGSAGNTAAGRHEPRRQGICRQPRPRRPGCLGAVALCRRRTRAADRADRQPVRRRSDSRCSRSGPRDAGRRAPRPLRDDDGTARHS